METLAGGSIYLRNAPVFEPLGALANFIILALSTRCEPGCRNPCPTSL